MALADTLEAYLKRSGESARALSLRCGLREDAVRAVLRGKSKAPKGEVIAKLAAAIGVDPGDLLRGELNGAGSPADAVEISEFELVPGSGDAAIRARRPVASWRIPADVLGERGLDPADVVILRAPSPSPEGIRTGDRLLVDVSERARLPSPPGILVLYDGIAHVLDAVRVVRGAPWRGGGPGQGGHPMADEDVVGRVVGRLEWR